MDYSNVRHFYLKNELGKVFELTSKFEMDKESENKNKTFLSEPEGFGTNVSRSYLKVGNDFFKISENDELSQISGVLMFQNYNQYLSFQKYVSDATELKFYQELPFDISETPLLSLPLISAYVEMPNVEKTEKDVNGWLYIPCTFDRITPWQSDIIEQKIMELSAGDGTKTYKIDSDSYEYVDEGSEKELSPRYGGDATNVVEIVNYGTMGTYPTIKMYANITEPRIIVRNFNTNAVIFDMRIKVSLVENDELFIDFNPNSYVVSKNGSSIYNYVDGNFDSELEIPPGKFLIEVQQTAEFEVGDIIIQYRYNFRSV